MQAPGAPATVILVPTAGAAAQITTTDSGMRGMCTAENRNFAVIGTGFWEFFTATQTATRRGMVSEDANLATISYNGLSGRELFITSGNNGYIFALDTNTLTQVLTAKALMGGVKDGRFLAFDPATGKVQMSALNDGLTWDSTLYFQRSLQADPWQAMLVSGSEIYMIGSETGEVWYNAGTFPQPFAPIPGSSFPWGTTAPFSVKEAGGQVVWLAHSAHGGGQIVAARGGAPRPISTPSVANVIGGFSDTTDCETLVYEEAGHLYVNFNFTSAKSTQTIDLTTGLWHERGTWISARHEYDAWHPRVFCECDGIPMVGERGSGVIAWLTRTWGFEADGSLIRRLRVGPPVWAAIRKRLSVDLFTLRMDAGDTGDAQEANGQWSNPTIALRESTDTRNWGPSRVRSTGTLGKYGTVVSWTRCASSLHSWTPEIVVSDPVPFKLAGADIQGSGLILGKAAA